MDKNINLSNLDTKNGKIDWVTSALNRRVVNFEYNKKTGSFIIKSYSHSTRKCQILYNDKIFSIPTSSIINCKLRNLFVLQTNEHSKPIKQLKDNTNHIYYLYCHKNIYNGKMYFGITKNIPEKRWNKGKGYSNNEYFTRAINKYGWGNGFSHKIILSGLTEKEASEKEKFYIREYKTNDRNYGYNLAVGGIDEMCGSENPNAREIYQFSLSGEFIKKWNCIKDAGNSIGINNTGNIQRALNSKTHMAYNYLWTDYFSNKISPYKLPNKIFQYELNGNLIEIYANSSFLPSEYNKNRVNDCCTHKSFSYKNHIWLYENDIENLDFYIRLNKYAKHSHRPVIQYDLNNNPLATFVSIYEAEEKTGINYQLIYKNCVGELNTTQYKYKWKYIKCEKLKPEVLSLPIKDD